MNVLAHATGHAPVRVGLVTSRRVGNAVARNGVRRRLREIVRAELPRLRPDHWIVLVAKRAAVEASHADLRGEWQRLARKAALFEA